MALDKRKMIREQNIVDCWNSILDNDQWLENHSYNSGTSCVAMFSEKNWGKVFIEIIKYLEGGRKGSTAFLKLNKWNIRGFEQVKRYT